MYVFAGIIVFVLLMAVIYVIGRREPNIALGSNTSDRPETGYSSPPRQVDSSTEDHTPVLSNKRDDELFENIVKRLAE